MSDRDFNRRANGQFAPNLLGKKAPTPSSQFSELERVPTTPYEGELSSFYWSRYKAHSRRAAITQEHPALFPDGGSWYEDSSDEDTLVYLYVSKGNVEPLRWFQVDRSDADTFRVLEMDANGSPREILAGGAFTSAAE